MSTAESNASAAIIGALTLEFCRALVAGRDPLEILAAIRDALVTTLGCDPVDAANVARAISIMLAEPESVTPRYRAAVRAGLLDAQLRLAN